MTNASSTTAAAAAGPATVVAPLRSRGYWATVWLRLRRDKVSMGCAGLLLGLMLMALLAPWLAPHDPALGVMSQRLAPIGTPGHWLGTDELGRDMLSRLMHGGRMSLVMGLLPVFIAFVVGTGLGVVAGFFGGWLNSVIMRTTDVFFAFPAVLLAIAISGALGAGFANAIISLTLVFIPPIARVAESITTSVRNLDFVDAARATGAGAFTLIRVHVLGNVLGPVFIYATSLVSVCMILAAGLSFLGLGVKPPVPEWGLMLNTLRQSIYLQPWVSVLPGLMIFITSLCFNLLSDGLRSAMDIKR
ncbi:binding-protein-dependent transport systems inner membrane component [Thauera sp. 27]|uniref:ABC transporter permease n=1 Tax=Thauera sp. 27 TaxID=305700 RepID=UPI0002CDA6F0|nr:ABC transporter permease [Thauera sp. 27]ENO81605.1 binding-protein-dependent transport systems inner membrane component [Thauera sp. 27]